MPCARRIGLVTRHGKHGQVAWHTWAGIYAHHWSTALFFAHGIGRSIPPPVSPEAWWTDDKVRSVIVSGSGIAFHSAVSVDLVRYWEGRATAGRPSVPCFFLF